MGRAIEAVLFDIDDTLVDTRSAFRTALSTAFAPWLPATPETADAVLRRWRADAKGLYRRYTRGELAYHEQRSARVGDILNQAGVAPLGEGDYERWSHEFDAAFAAAWRPWRDTSVVDQLVAAGLALGAVSNAPVDMQRAKLAATGLADRVPLLVGIDTLGVGKPEPEVFLEGCRRLGSRPGATAYVGDEFAIDAQAASATGLLGVWVRRPGYDEVDPGAASRAGASDVVTIDSLTDLPRVLAVDGGE